jgi:hypothetical protein
MVLCVPVSFNSFALEKDGIKNVPLANVSLVLIFTPFISRSKKQLLMPNTHVTVTEEASVFVLI